MTSMVYGWNRMVWHRAWRREGLIEAFWGGVVYTCLEEKV